MPLGIYHRVIENQSQGAARVGSTHMPSMEIFNLLPGGHNLILKSHFEKAIIWMKISWTPFVVQSQTFSNMDNHYLTNYVQICTLEFWN